MHKFLKTILIIVIFLSINNLIYSQLAAPLGVLAPPSYAKCTPKMLYAANDPNQNVFGTDKNYTNLTHTVQLFEIDNTTTYNIVGVVVWIGNLKVNGTAGKVSFSIVDFCGYTGMTWASKQAGQTVPNQYSPDWGYFDGSATKLTSDLKETKCLDDANVVMFDKPVTVNSGATCVNKFGISVDLSQIGDDVVGMYSTDINQGAMGAGNSYKELSWQYDKTTDSWITILASTGGVINADMLIFPIIDKTKYSTSPKTNVCAGSSAINESSINNFKIEEFYPNPATDKIFISTSSMNANIADIEIFDVTGKLLINHATASSAIGSKTQIDISKLTKGIYFIKLTSDKKTITTKFVKE